MALCCGNVLAAEKGPIHFVMLMDLTGPVHSQVAPVNSTTMEAPHNLKLKAEEGK